MVLLSACVDSGAMTTTNRPLHRTAPAIRVLGGLVVAAATGYAALVMLWVGMIEFTGCFLECSTPNHPKGILLLLGAAASAAAAVTAATYALFAHRIRLTTVYLTSVAAALLLLLFLAAR